MQHCFRRDDNGAGRYSLCRVDTRSTMHPLLGLNKRSWQDFAYLSPSGLKILTIAWNSSHSYRRCMTRPSPRYKLMVRLQEPFAYNVPLNYTVQWAWYYSLWFWIDWYVRWNDILLASELDIGHRRTLWWHTPTLSRFCDITSRL